MILWPTPDAIYTLTYRFIPHPDALTTAAPYPYGGAAHAETLIESCLAVAEQRMNHERGLHYAAFMDRLGASVAYDRRQAPEFYGYCGDNSSDDSAWSPRLVNYATVNGLRN